MSEGSKGEVAAFYYEPLATKEMRCPRLSRRVNDTTILRAFLEFTMRDVLN
jgi:hypothetical protein